MEIAVLFKGFQESTICILMYKADVKRKYKNLEFHHSDLQHKVWNASQGHASVFEFSGTPHEKRSYSIVKHRVVLSVRHGNQCWGCRRMVCTLCGTPCTFCAPCILQ